MTGRDEARRMRTYAQWLAGQGYGVVYAAGHYRVSTADGEYRATIPSTPSDRRAYLNTLSMARRVGLPSPPKTRHPKKKADR